MVWNQLLRYSVRLDISLLCKKLSSTNSTMHWYLASNWNIHITLNIFYRAVCADSSVIPTGM